MLMPMEQYNKHNALALIFKITTVINPKSKHPELLVYIRIYCGYLKTKDTVINTATRG